MTLGVAGHTLVSPVEDHAPSLGHVLVDALVFWLRHQAVFWLMALPIAGLAAAIAYILEANQAVRRLAPSLGLGFPVRLIYAMFLDRWIKEALLEDARAVRRGRCVAPLDHRAPLPALRRRPLPAGDGARAPASRRAGAVLWTAAAALFALLLPALAAGEPSSLRQAFALGRPLQIHLFLLIGGASLLSLAAGSGPRRGLPDICPTEPWTPPPSPPPIGWSTGLLLAFVGYGLARSFAKLTGWQQPEPRDRPYRGICCTSRFFDHLGHGRRRRRA